MTDKLVKANRGGLHPADTLARYAAAAHGAFAGNTERAIRADTAIFTAWCGARNLALLPAAPQTVADFIDAMRDKGQSKPRKPATIRRYVSSISHLHRAAKLPNPA